MASVAGVHQLPALVLTVVPPDAGATSWTDAVAAGAAVLAALAGVVAALAALGTLFVTVVAVGVAVFAAWYAKGQVDGARAQLDEARTLRLEQARPYVVVYAVTRDNISPQLVDVVIENLGATGAVDVTFTASPPLLRTDGSGGSEEVALPETMPFLAPHQQWRTFWDAATTRHEQELPDRFEVTTCYTDSHHESHTETFVLDWRQLRGRQFPDERTIHHAAKSLHAIDKTLSAWASKDNAIRVATYDGEELDAQRAEQYRQGSQQLAALEAVVFRNRPKQDPSPEGEPS